MPTITIDLTAQQANRLADAWERKYGERPTIQQVKDFLVNDLRQFVYQAEMKEEARKIQLPTFDPT